MDVCRDTCVDDEKDLQEKKIGDGSNTNEEINKLEQCKQDSRVIEENDIKLKDRINQCKNIIASLKLELSEEKNKIEKEAKAAKSSQISDAATHSYTYSDGNTSDKSDLLATNLFSVCVDSKFNCDESLIEYEKQLQRYQNTLNMAQIEKKNAIRKQMLAKAYKLKLLEVENQCNIEILRIKQSLQCLEPLQMIADKWKSGNDDVYDLDNYELIPRYPELNETLGSDVLSNSDLQENKMAVTTDASDKVRDSI
ncbi:unnamed protein product [Danaus chrysippus]|uniref:(African queen) hypothetical protein n=1 Tax=Danaus chrysippus TaxID=151541 RepID=A0A8J2VY96_9NEOP|nr:unnamed protein product [Danaus chrysippus]